MISPSWASTSVRLLAGAALALTMAACTSQSELPKLNLGGVSMREDAYRAALQQLIRSDDEVCGTWLREGTEPLTAMANKTTAGANAKDLVRAMALFSQECFAR